MQRSTHVVVHWFLFSAVCVPPCENGVCDRPGTCICEPGWTGSRCRTGKQGYSITIVNYSWVTILQWNPALWKAAIYNIADTSLVLNAFTYVCVQSKPLKCYPLKQTHFLVTLVPGLYKIHLIMWMLICFSHKIVHHHWFDSTTGHYNSTSTSLCSAFLASVQQGRTLECSFRVLNSTIHITMPNRNIWKASEIWMSLFPTHSGCPYVVRGQL